MVPISLALHAGIPLLMFLGSLVLAFIGPCGGPEPPQINYVSIISLPAGVPDGGGRKPGNDLVTPPTPPPIREDSMALPTTRPTRVARAQVTPTPNLKARDDALETARTEALRAAALNRLRTQAGHGDGPSEGPQGVPGGDWNALPGAVPYEALVRATIEANWMPPTWVLEKKKTLICQIHIRIGFDGRIISRNLVKRSGDTAYDASALAAIDKTEKLPLPPDETREYLLRKGITLRFNPRSKMQ